MLARLSIRDIVLIERLDIEFSRGLAVLTGETGAGKSILLDAFALALGGRGDAGLVRNGVEQGQVTATFDVPKGHPATKILSENGLDDSGEMILRRVQLADGRTRAFINDQSISVQTLKAVVAEDRRGRMPLGDIEYRGDLPLLHAVPDQAGVAAATQRQRESIEQNGFAGAGLAGQNRKAPGKLDIEPFDQDDVTDRKTGEHAKSIPSRDPVS